MSHQLLSIALENERDVVVARQRSREIAGLLGFDSRDQTRIATAVSEIARNCVRYARNGRAEFSVEGATQPQVLLIRVSDRGPGIPDLPQVLNGDHRSSTGMGIGIDGSRRLMDGFEIASGREGTHVVLKKLVPRSSTLLTASGAAKLAQELAQAGPRDVYEEVQRQNQELLHALDDLRARQEELLRLNRELQDTNRGVLALYAELDERADNLRRADELKTRFLSNMSHEFRTPLSSTLALTRLLLDRLDGPLTDEQEHQVTLIRRGAEQLLELVNDMLDLAKVQAGKIAVRPHEFSVQDLFGALRGMLRPLLVGERVRLVIEAPDGLPLLHTDEGKVSQILRNLISNALKFTEEGEVRVSADYDFGRKRVRFSVTDTGIGIAAEDQARIFEEFSQVDSPIQKRVHGTGLGLPLSRRLAVLLGGELEVESRVGAGSRFVLEVPRAYAPAPAREVEAGGNGAQPAERLDRLRVPVVLIEDDEAQRLAYEAALRNTRFQPLLAANLREARELLEVGPAAIVLDLTLDGEDAWEFLAGLKVDQSLRKVPVLVVTVVDDERKALALGADGYRRKPIEPDELVAEIARLTGQSSARARNVLVVDDDQTFRYALRRDLERLGCAVEEASNGNEGLERARERRAELVFLDLSMPFADGDGESMLEALRTDPETSPVPVVLISEGNGSGPRLQQAGSAVFVHKRDLSPECMDALLRGTLSTEAVRQEVP